jgi:Protein of unknown function (DUF2934)
VAQEKQDSRTKAEKEQQLSTELEGTFPASDPPASTQPGGGITGPEAARPETREEAIRERAYQIWLGEGQVHGRDKEHWHAAARELDADDEEVAAKPNS